MKTYNQRQSFSRLIAVGLTKSEALSIARLVQKWVNTCGEEETVKRLKTLKDAYLHHLVGQRHPLPWFKKHPDGRPKGPLGILWKFKRIDLFRCWNAIMVYTSMTYQFQGRMPRMTARQYAKFVKAVYREPVNPDFESAAEVLIENFLSVYSFPSFKAKSGMPVRDFVGSPTRRAPTPSGYMKTAVEEDTVIDSIQVLALRPRFTREHWAVYSGTLLGFEDTWEGMVWTQDNSTTRCKSGRIGIVQEPGYKARIVANPYRVHQCAMEPLKKYLFSILRMISNDYVYDQEAGVQYIKKFVESGKPVFSIDLTNASDNLPLSLQKTLLKRIGIPEYWINAFAAISSGDWELPVEWLPDLNKVKKYLGRDSGFYPLVGSSRQGFSWNVGQPLGLGPSFASAFLLHHAIVVGLHVLCSAPLEYAMVGDDLVLTNESVYQHYVWLMNGLGVEVSKEKSLVSDKGAEFLSRVILPDQILRGYKWRGSGDNSFWDVAKNLGPRSLRLFQRRQRHVLRVLGELPEPYGLGWNPKGLTRWERIEPWLDALQRTDIRVRSYESSVRSLNRKLYNSILRFTTNEGYPISAIPDQGIVTSLRRVLPYNIAALGELALPNIEYLAHLIDDLGPQATAEQINYVRKVSGILSDFTTLEKACDITTLIQKERLISRRSRS